MEKNYIITPNGELYHAGVKGMKWGRRRNRAAPDKPNGRRSPNGTSPKSRKSVLGTLNKKTGGELARRGKSALDVLMNGDTDWMGNSTSSDNVVQEAKNRGKAVLERLMYSEDQIDNKKFFGRYNF